MDFWQPRHFSHGDSVREGFDAVMETISRILGLDSQLDSSSESSLRLSDMWQPGWLLVILLLAVIVYYGWQYRRDARKLSGFRLTVLSMLRLAVVGIIVLMLIKPVLNISHQEKRIPVVAVLVDESLSMDYPDARNHPFVDFAAPRDERSRFAVARETTSRLVGEMGLNRNHRAVVYRFSGTLERVREVAADGEEKTTNGEAARQLKEALDAPTGAHSNAGDALIDVMRELENNKVSGMVLISDGRSTATPQSGAVSLDEAAQRLKQAGIPVNTIATGTAEPLRDLALRELAAPREANVDDVLSMRVTVVNHIEPGLETELTLLENDEPKVVRNVRLQSGRNDIVMSMIVEGPELGERKYTIKAPEFDDELTYENNQVSAHVEIVKRTLRCLLIAGKPTVEYHYIWPALVRDPIIEVSCWLHDADVNYVQQGNAPIEHLPETVAEWDKYDVVVLYDIDPEKFTNEQETGLEQLIRTGGGLLVIAGRSHGLDSLLTVRTAKMGAMLPVEIDRNRHPDYTRVFDQPFAAVRTSAGKSHPLLMFDPSPAGNDKVWESFPQFYWHHPTMSAKPQAITLLEKENAAADDPDGDTLIAVWRYGEGAVFYSGIDSMWRWRFPFENYDYDRFYTQTVRYLGETRLLGSQKQVVLQTDEKLYSPGGDVQISLTVLDPALLAQLRSESLLATVTDPQGGQFRVPLALAGAKSQALVGHYRPKRVGEYAVHAEHTLADATSEQKTVFDETTHFNVRLQSLEDADTTADLESLARLASITGGKSYDHTNIATLGELPSSIPSDPQLIPHRTEEDIWDSPLFLAVFLLLISTEWALRKMWSLL